MYINNITFLSIPHKKERKMNYKKRVEETDTGDIR